MKDEINEKDIINMLNSMDDDLVDAEIEKLLADKGEEIDMEGIKSKALDRLRHSQERKKTKRFIGKRGIIAIAAAAALLSLSTVYAEEIQISLKSFFGKSVVYQTVVDGDAFYLSEAVKLNDMYTLVDASVSEGKLEMTIESVNGFEDDKISTKNISVTSLNGKEVRYIGGGYMLTRNNGLSLSFMNEKEKNYDIKPFQDFRLSIDGKDFEVSLAKAESVKVDGNLSVGVPETAPTKTAASTAANTTEEATEQMAEETPAKPLIANVAAVASEKDGKTVLQLVPAFDDPDLKFREFGEYEPGKFIRMFENDFEGGGSIGSSTAPGIKTMYAYDKDGNSYPLKMPEGITSRDTTFFETDAPAGTELTVKIPAIAAGYEKQVAAITLPIPKEGKEEINTELDFVIQRIMVKSIERTGKDTAEVVFQLNTGADRSVSLFDISCSSKDVKKGETVRNESTATMTVTFEENTNEAEFIFNWPRYVIQGNWSIQLNGK